MKPTLTKAERKAIKHILAAKTFDEALHRTPESLFEKFFDSSFEGAHDLFDTDLFPEDWKPMTPEEEAALNKKVEALFVASKKKPPKPTKGSRRRRRSPGTPAAGR